MGCSADDDDDASMSLFRIHSLVTGIVPSYLLNHHPVLNYISFLVCLVNVLKAFGHLVGLEIRASRTSNCQDSTARTYAQGSRGAQTGSLLSARRP
jgi:hypothetical protein